jgi:hypothetical protein
VSDLLDLCIPNATWHLSPCAEVRVGDHVTRYVRRGTGPSVVLVGPDVSANAIWVPLVEHLAPGHRIVVPQLPPADADVAAWLRGFIEGIGLTSTVLIAGNGSSAAALEVATADDFLVRKVVIMPRGDDPVTAAETERTLVVAPDTPTAESLRRIAEFIG